MSKPPKKGKSSKNKEKIEKPLSGADIAEMAMMMERMLQLAGVPGGLDEEDADPFMDDAVADLGSPLAVAVTRLPSGAGLPLPARQTPGASGLDLAAAVPEAAPLTLKPGERALVPTGFAFEIPPSFEAQVRPRSGLALKHGVTVLNAPGTIDSDYRGEIGVILVNHGAEPFTIVRGDRIAQLVFGMIVRAEPVEEVEIAETPRGKGGFGSTGVKSPRK